MAKISSYPLVTPLSGDMYVLVRAGNNYRADDKTIGRIAQAVHTQTGAVATGTTLIPLDDTIPLITEGNEFLTLAITPTSATSKLLIEASVFISNSLADTTIVALFRDAVTDALAVMAQYQDSNGGINPIFLRHEMTAGGVAAITFRIRAGAAAGGTLTFNGFGGNRKFGGVIASSLRITEFKV